MFVMIFYSFVTNNAVTCRNYGWYDLLLVCRANANLNPLLIAFLGHFDFIYSVPDAWLACPFTFIGE